MTNHTDQSTDTLILNVEIFNVFVCVQDVRNVDKLTNLKCVLLYLEYTVNIP